LLRNFASPLLRMPIKFLEGSQSTPVQQQRRRTHEQRATATTATTANRTRAKEGEFLFL
jgi:hypothetical protein